MPRVYHHMDIWGYQPHPCLQGHIWGHRDTPIMLLLKCIIQTLFIRLGYRTPFPRHLPWKAHGTSYMKLNCHKGLVISDKMNCISILCPHQCQIDSPLGHLPLPRCQSGVLAKESPLPHLQWRHYQGLTLTFVLHPHQWH